MEQKPKIIAVDFDGTLVMHEYPLVGREVPGGVAVCRDLLAAGHRIILFTMRHDAGLRDAVQWCHEQGIELFGVNENPEQSDWTDSPKPYANQYVDDAAVGCPLIRGVHKRPYVDWDAVRRILVADGIL